MHTPAQRILVTVTGRDAPGITAALTGIVGQGGGDLEDIEQVVMQGQLTLCLVVVLRDARAQTSSILKDLLFEAKKLGMDMDFHILDTQAKTDAQHDEKDEKSEKSKKNEQNKKTEKNSKPIRYAVTAVGETIDANDIHSIATVLAENHANIDVIRKLSDGLSSINSLEVVVSVQPAWFLGQDPYQNEDEYAAILRQALLHIAAEKGFDIAVQPETLARRQKRLVVMDMDSTLITIEVIDELARLHGVYEQVADVTARAMAGQLRFEESLRERVALLSGLSVEKVQQLARSLPLTAGAARLIRVLRGLGYKTAVISGGFTFAADALKQNLGLDYAFANQLEIRDGKLTGRVLEPIVGAQRKADLLDALAQREGIPLEQTIAIGDGANDILMLQRAGLGIAFHAKAKLKAAADTSLSVGGLDRILYFLGFKNQDIEDFLHTQF